MIDNLFRICIMTACVVGVVSFFAVTAPKSVQDDSDFIEAHTYKTEYSLQRLVKTYDNNEKEVSLAAGLELENDFCIDTGMVE